MKRPAAAVGRNRQPIAAVLGEVLPEGGLVLEVASGTGEHAVHFDARHSIAELDCRLGERRRASQRGQQPQHRQESCQALFLFETHILIAPVPGYGIAVR